MLHFIVFGYVVTSHICIPAAGQWENCFALNRSVVQKMLRTPGLNDSSTSMTGVRTKKVQKMDGWNKWNTITRSGGLSERFKQLIF